MFAVDISASRRVVAAHCSATAMARESAGVVEAMQLCNEVQQEPPILRRSRRRLFTARAALHVGRGYGAGTDGNVLMRD